MKKNTILLALLLILGGVTYWYWKYVHSATSMTGGDWEFAVKDTASIQKIFLADRKTTETITLVREGKNWKMNSQSLSRKTKNRQPRMDAVQNLLKVLHNVSLQYRLPRATVKGVIENLASNSVKVELYDSRDKKIKCYYVGSEDQDGTATYMIMEDSNEPYAIGMTSFVGSLRPYFFTREEEWRDRTVFAERVENIDSVSIQYPLQQNKSFKMAVNGGKNYVVEPFYAMTAKISRPVTKGLSELFLKGFESQIAEGFENNHPNQDSIRASQPFSIITVKRRDGFTKKVRLFNIITRDKTSQPIVDPTRGVIIERYFADVNDGEDLMLVQNQNYEAILWAYESFFVQR